MATAVGVIGIIIAALGLAFAILPGTAKAFAGFFSVPSRIYFGLGLRFVLGIFFIYASRYCRPENFSQQAVLGIGVLAVSMAVLFGMLGPSRIQAIVQWLLSMPPRVLRLTGGVSFGLGVYLIYASGAF